MKILLITATNLYLTPYVHYYLSINNGIFDIAYWDRHNLDEKSSNHKNIYRFVTPKYKENISKIKKILYYIKFVIFLKKVIKQNKYKKVIFLQSSIAVFMTSFLHKHLASHYIVDIRDYSFEGFGLFRKLEKKNFKSAYALFISSDGFRNFLPKSNYQVVHNYNPINSTTKQYFLNKDIQTKHVIISFIGLVRFQEQNKRIIDFFKNDERFTIRFIGKGANELLDYVMCNSISNVELIDYFDPSQTISYYKETDFIMNLYGNHTPLLDYALSNKLYYAASLYLPVLVCPDTYMEKISKEYGFGITIDFNNPKTKDDVISFWKVNNRENFISKCDSFIDKVEKDMKQFQQIVREFINE